MNVTFGEWNYNIPTVIRSISMKCLKIVLHCSGFLFQFQVVVSLVDSVDLIEFSYQLLLNSVK